MPWKNTHDPKIRKRIRKIKSEAQARARAAGLCMSCLVRPQREGRTRCQECSDQRRDYYLRNRDRIIKAAGENQKKNREARRIYLRGYNREERLEVVAYLGGRCVRCGFSDHRALQIDHVNGDGWQELRRGDGYRGCRTRYKEILSGKAEGKYQLLCSNCNWIKRAEMDETTSVAALARRKAVA